MDEKEQAAISCAAWGLPSRYHPHEIHMRRMEALMVVKPDRLQDFLRFNRIVYSKRQMLLKHPIDAHTRYVLGNALRRQFSLGDSDYVFTAVARWSWRRDLYTADVFYRTPRGLPSKWYGGDPINLLETGVIKAEYLKGAR